MNGDTTPRSHVADLPLSMSSPLPRSDSIYNYHEEDFPSLPVDDTESSNSPTANEIFAKNLETKMNAFYADMWGGRKAENSLAEDRTQNVTSPVTVDLTQNVTSPIAVVEKPESINFRLASIIEAERDLQDLLDSVEQLRAKTKNIHAKISQLSNDICQKLDKEDAKYGLQRVAAGEVDETDSEMSTAVYPSPAEEMPDAPTSMISTSLIFNDDLKELLVRNNELLARLAKKEKSMDKHKGKISFKPISRLMHRLPFRHGTKDHPTETAVVPSDVVEHCA